MWNPLLQLELDQDPKTNRGHGWVAMTTFTRVTNDK
jgi:hypothetical protein